MMVLVTLVLVLLQGGAGGPVLSQLPVDVGVFVICAIVIVCAAAGSHRGICMSS